MRRQMSPRQVIETILRQYQLRIFTDAEKGMRPVIVCGRTGQEITLANVNRVEIEHWPVAHEHGGPTDPNNAIVSLKEAHLEHTARETQGRGKERRLRIARLAKSEVEQRIGTKPKFRLKKKLDGSVVRVRTK